MGARPSHTIWGTQVKHRSRAVEKGPQSLESASGSPGEVWTDALAESLTPERESPNETAIKHRGEKTSQKLKRLLHLSSRKRQEIVRPAPSAKRGTSGTVPPTNPAPLVVAGDGSAQATTEVTKDKNHVESINTFGSTRPPVKVPRRSSSLGKCGLKPGARPKLDAGSSAYTARPLTETESVADFPLEEFSIKHQISTRRARAKITAGTFTCASPAGLSVSPIGNPYLPYGMGREPGITPYSTLSTNTTNTAEGSAATAATGSAECSSASTHLGRISPRKELEQDRANGYSPKKPITARDRAGYRYTSFQGIPDPEFSVTERHKQHRHQKHRQKCSPKEQVDKGKGRATSPLGVRVKEQTQNLDGAPVDKNGSQTSTSRQSTPSERRRKSIRSSGTRSKIRRATCPPEIFCALVWLDGQVPYSTDSGEESEDGMEPWERELQAALGLGGEGRASRSEGLGVGRKRVDSLVATNVEAAA